MANIGIGGAVGGKAKKKKKKPYGGNIVPVGGEAPMGMYSGNTGELIKPAKAKYVAQKWNKKGKATYTPAFKVTEKGTLVRSRQFSPETKEYGSLSSLTGPSPYSREYRDKIVEAKAREMNGDEENNSPWAMFARGVGDVAPLRWAWSSFSSAVGVASNALEWYDKNVQDPYNHFIATAATVANPRSSGRGDWSKSWAGTYGLDSNQAIMQNPLVPTSWASETNRPWNTDVDVELGDTSGLTPEQKADAERRVREAENRTLKGLDPANPEDHAAIREWSENTLLGKYATGGMTFATMMTAGDPAFIAGKGIKVTKGAVQGSNYLATLGKQGFVKLIDDAAVDLGGAGTKGKTLVEAKNFDDLTKQSFAAGEKARKLDGALDEAVDLTKDPVPLSNAARRKQARVDRKVAARRESMRRNLDWLTKQTDEATIAEHSMVKGSTYSDGLAGLLANADNVDDVALILKASVGDDETLNVLRETRTWMGTVIDNMHKHNAWLGDFKSDPVAGRFAQVNPTHAGSALGKFKNIEDEKAFVTRYLDDMRSTDDRFAKLLDPNMVGSLVPQRAYKDGNFSRFASIESHRLNKAERKGEQMWDTRVWQENKWAIPVRVVRWGARQKPNNWIQFSGVSDAASAGPAFRSWLQSSDQRIVNPQMRQDLYAKYTAAVGQGDDVMLSTLDEIEESVMMQYAAFHGKKVMAVPDEVDINDYLHYKPVSDKVQPPKDLALTPTSKLDKLESVVRYNNDPTVLADARRRIAAAENPSNSLYDQLSGIDRRRPASNWKADPEKGVRSAADTYKNDKKFRAAQVSEVKENNQFLADWATAVQQWQAHRNVTNKKLGDRGGYYIDDDGALSIVPGYESQLAGSRPMIDLKRFGHVAAGTSSRWDVKALDSLKLINSGLQQIYRPLVLLSFRYTLRNNFEAQLRALAVTGAATYDPNTLRAMGLNAVNRGKKGMARVDGKGRRALARQEAKLQKTLYGDEGYATLRDSLQMDLDSLGEFMEKDDRELFGKMITRLNEKYGSVMGAADQMRQLNDVVPKYQAKLDEVAKGYDTLNAKRARSGDYSMQLGTAEAPGMLARGADNPAADAMLLNLSADETASMIFTLRHNAREKAFRKALIRENTIVKPGNKGYWDSLAHFASNTLNGSELARLRLTGASDSEFLTYIRSPEGQGTRKLANQLGKNLHDERDLIQWFHEGAETLNRYFPDGELRQKILRGEKVTPDELRVRLGHLEESGELPAIAGTEIIAEHGLPSGKSVWDRWRGATQAAFVALGSVPESNLTRYPMGVALYKKHLARQVQIHGDEYVKRNMDSVVRQAERAAVRDVKEVQYTVERYSNLAASFEPVSPFFQAKANSMRVWSRLIANDPAVIARAAQLWELTDKTVDINTGAIANADVPGWSTVMDATGMSDVDENEQGRIDFKGIWSILLSQNPQVETAIKDAEGKDTFSEASAASLMLGAVLPQFGGPMVSPAASEIYKHFAAVESDNFFVDMIQDTLADVSGYLSPQGASNSFMSWETVAPGVLKSAERMLSQQDSDAFNATAMAIHADSMVRWARDGAEGPQPTFAESVERAKGLYKWQMFYQLTSPFGGVEGRNELDPIRDEIKGLYDQGKSKVEIQKLVYDKYGFDYAALMLPSQDKFGGVAPTMKTVQWLQKNSDMLARYLEGSDGKVADPATASKRMSELVKLIPDLAYGEYDAKAVSLLRTMNIPGMDRQWYDSYEAPGASMTNSLETQKGWRAQNQMTAEYNKRKAKIDAKFPNKDVKGSGDYKKFWNEMNDLMAARDSTISEIKSEHPVWSEDTRYFTNDTSKQSLAIGLFTQMKSDKKLWGQIESAHPEYISTVETFLDFRNRKIVDMKKAGNTRNGYDREATAALKEERAKYEWGVDELKKSNTQFADMFDSFFQSELYDERGPTVATPGVWVPRAWNADEIERRRRRGF